MSVTYQGSSTSSTGTTSVTPGIPTPVAADDLLVLVVVAKYAFASTPSGWTLLSQVSGGSGSSGLDSGLVYTSVFYKVAAGGETGTVTVSIGSGNSAIADIFRYSKSTANPWRLEASKASQNSASLTWNLTGDAEIFATSGDLVEIAMGINSSLSTVSSPVTVSMAGLTSITSYNEISEIDSSSGDRCSLMYGDFDSVSGYGVDTPVVSITLSGSSTNYPAGGVIAFVISDTPRAEISTAFRVGVTGDNPSPGLGIQASLPARSKVGDLLIIYLLCGINPVIVTSGFTDIYDGPAHSGSGTDSQVAYKYLDSTDISNGYITVDLNDAIYNLWLMEVWRNAPFLSAERSETTDNPADVPVVSVPPGAVGILACTYSSGTVSGFINAFPAGYLFEDSDSDARLDIQTAYVLNDTNIFEDTPSGTTSFSGTFTAAAFYNILLGEANLISPQPWNFWAGDKWRPMYDDVNVEVEEPTAGKDKTKLSLVSSSYDINSGTSATLTATLKSAGSGLSSKSIQFQQNVNGSWQTVATVSTNGSGVATTSVSPTTTRKYRARFIGDGSYVAGRSSVIDVTVRVLKNVTKRFYCDWSQTYNVNDSQHSSTDLYQSMKDVNTTGATKRKSLAGFDHVKIQEFLTTYYAAVGMKISVKTKPFVGKRTIVWGLHDYTSKPTTWGDARVSQDLEKADVNGSSRYSWDLADTYVDDFASGLYTGLALGPAPSLSSDYIMGVEGNGNNEEPWIEFTVQKWLPT